VISCPALPVDVLDLPNGDTLLLPAVWPVRLTPEQRQHLAAILAGRNPRADLTE
jgi:hypothetical protein